MTNSLETLTLILIATALMAFPYVLDRIAIRGLFGAMSNPRSADKPLHGWAVRAKNAHANAVENLVVFAPALVVVHVAGLSNDLTASASLVYLVARLLHYTVYLIGIPVARTLFFLIGWVATASVLAQAIGVL